MRHPSMAGECKRIKTRTGDAGMRILRLFVVETVHQAARCT
jgi:hypothetical protein